MNNRVSKILIFFTLMVISGCEYLFDFKPPEITVVSPADGANINGVVVLEVLVKDEHLKSVKVYWNENTLGTYIDSVIVDTFFLGPSSGTMVIKAWDIGGNWSEKKIELKIGIVQIVSPEDGVWVWNKNTGFAYVFVWRNVLNATKYEIQFDNEENFGSLEVDTVLSDTQFAWSVNIGRFYWRVRAGNNIGWGPWSEVRLVEIGPYEAGYYNSLGNAWDVFVLDNYAYVADWYSDLRVIDISNPSLPQEIGYYYTPGDAEGIFVLDNYAYVADNYSGLRVIDISNPSSPQEVGYYDTPGYSSGVYVSGSYAYIADWYAGLRVIDISNPSSPQEVGYYDTPGIASGVYVSGSYAYIADKDAGLRIIKISPQVER